MAAGYRLKVSTSKNCGYFVTRRLYIVEFSLVKSLGNDIIAKKGGVLSGFVKIE